MEARNGVQLSKYVSALARLWAGDRKLNLTPEIICECNRLAMQGIYSTAGTYRDRFVAAGNYVPPNRRLVPTLVQEMCDDANQMSEHPLQNAAFLLWRVNWVHPFFDGNGRIARELSYLALRVGNGLDRISGTPTIPELLDLKYRDKYYKYLEEADRAWTVELVPDVRKLESLISTLLVEQIESSVSLE